MSQVQPLPPAESGKLAANQAVVRGRVLEMKRTEGGVFTVVILPAPDQFSKPEAVEIRSKGLIGKPQDDITVRVALAGYRRQYKDGHGETQYATNVFLRAVED